MSDNLQYSPLEKNEIRLVTLHAGQFSSTLEVTASNAKFTPTLHRQQSPLTAECNNPKYEALSYIWGPPDPNGPSLNFRIKDHILNIAIRPTLEQALKHLRQEKKDRVFYIDFLSVSQDNEKEKTQQIDLFSDVFYNASSVCIWLGPAADDSDFAMDFIAHILDFHKFDQLTAFPLNGDNRRSWLAFSKLIGREWFQRRWIVQEMALARYATVHCGSKSCSWVDFSDALALFQSRWLNIFQDIHHTDPLNVGEIQPPGATSLVTISANIFRKDGKGNIEDRRYDLETLLTTLPIFNITQPADAIWSVAALASDFDDVRIALADFAGGTPALPLLFARVVDYIIKKSQTLDIICYPWAPGPGLESPSQAQREAELSSSKYPSWIGEVSNFPYSRRHDGQYDRNNADSLVGLPGQRCYKASGGITMSTPTTKTTVTMKNPTSNYGGSAIYYEPTFHLCARGFVIDIVKDVGGCSEGTATIPQKWQQLAGWRRRDLEPAPDQFWRTIVADRTPNRDNPPSWYARACEHAARLSNTKFINITDLITRCQGSSHLQTFLRRVQAVIWNRTMFVTEKSGSLGLGPPSIQPGDLICVLFGCSVPIVLRKRMPPDGNKKWSGGSRRWEPLVDPALDGKVADYWERRDRSEEGYYEVVGECFANGWMEGQAVERHRAQLSVVANVNRETKQRLREICERSEQIWTSEYWVKHRKLKIERPSGAGGLKEWTFTYVNGKRVTEPPGYGGRHHPEIFVRDDGDDVEDIQTWKFTVVETRVLNANEQETVVELPDNVGFRQAIQDNVDGKAKASRLMYLNPKDGHKFVLL